MLPRKGEVRALRVAVVGARRERQGTGEFIARELARLGCSVPAILATRAESGETARRALRERHGIECRAYTVLDELLERERPDALVVASPPEHHVAVVERALEAGCHVFCEKPFFWRAGLEAPEGAGEVRATAERLVALAEAKERALAMNTQWPETLDAFSELYPGVLSQRLESLDMWLSPMSRGATMVVDSASHVLSLVHALAGEGRIETIACPRLSPEALELAFDYRHARGVARVVLHLVNYPEPPRPAAYAVNGRRVDRRIGEGYALSFEGGGRSVAPPDPLAARVARFVREASTGAAPDRFAIVEGMTQLHELVCAVAARFRELI